MIDNELHRVELIDGVIHAEYKPGIALIDLEMAKKMVRERLEVCNGVAYPLCGDISNLNKVTNEARDYLGFPEASENLTAMAIIRKSSIQNLLANFFLKVNKPVIPTRLFSDKKEALKWLERYKVHNMN